MNEGRLVQLVVFPGWLVGVTYRRSLGYRCWVINPDMAVLNDGERYSSSAAALEAGRLLVRYSTDQGFDSGRSR